MDDNRYYNDSDLLHKKEKRYYILVLLIAITVYVSLFLSIIGILFLVAGMIFSLFVHGLMLASIRCNGVRINPQQFPQIYRKVEELCERMGISSIPDVYILESSGFLNAFATRFFGRNMVVLYSSIVELIESGAEDELTFIIAHELAHIKRNHITKQMVILPAMWIPFIGEAYSRACEYTCDRIAAYYTGNSNAAKNSLTILAIGKLLYKHVDQFEYLQQINTEHGFFVWLSEKLSTHPPLPKRIHEIMLFMEEETADLMPHNRSFRTAFISSLVIIIILSLGITGVVYGIPKIKASNVWAEITLAEGATALMLATSENDLAQVQQLLKDEADPNVQDIDGWSALFYASQDNRFEIARELLKAGADPNLTTDYGITALTNAASANHKEVIKVLFEYGAKLDLQDNEGWTPLIYAADYGNVEAVKALLEAGANPRLRDNNRLTALDHAKYQGYQEIVDLLNRIKNN